MSDVIFRSAADWPDVDFEFRAGSDGLTFAGYAAVFDSESDDLGGFREIVRPGAFAESLRSRRDIKMFHNHNADIVLGSKRAGTLKLGEDSRGLIAETSLPDNAWGRPIADAVQRGDISAMSFGFQVLRDVPPKADAPRELLNVRLWEVSTVSGWPAYAATSTSVRHLAEEIGEEEEPLAAAFRVLSDADGKLTPEQHDLLVRAINVRSTTPVMDQFLARMVDKYNRATPAA